MDAQVIHTLKVQRILPTPYGQHFEALFQKLPLDHTRMCRDVRRASCPSRSDFGEHFESLHHFVFLDHTQDFFSARGMSRGWSSESTILLTRCNRSGVSSLQSLMKKIWHTHTQLAKIAELVRFNTWKKAPMMLTNLTVTRTSSHAGLRLHTFHSILLTRGHY